MSLEQVFVLAGMPCSGKSSLGRLPAPPPDWPLTDWWDESRMACTLVGTDTGSLPEKLAVEIDFSWHFSLEDSPLRLIQRLNARSIEVITVWGSPETLQRRLMDRRRRGVKHPNDDLLTDLYECPSKLADFYARWLTCVEIFKPDNHVVFDSDRNCFRGVEWLLGAISACRPS